MASPPVISFLNLPGVCLMVRAAALPPASCLIFAISALETVLSTVTTTRFVLASTAQAVPATSDLSTDLLTVLSCVALNICTSDAFALGMANEAAATSPVATAISRVRLVMPLRGVVRLILTCRSSTWEVGGPRGVGAREAQPGRLSGFRTSRAPDKRCGGVFGRTPDRRKGAFRPCSVQPAYASGGLPRHRRRVRSPAATAAPSVFPGGGKGQMKWSAKAHGGSSARLKSTVVRPSASGAAGLRNRKR